MEAQQIGENANLVYEVLKRVDARTLPRCSLVNRMWQEAAEDEEIWRLIWYGMGYNEDQRASVVRALGNSRRLLSIFLWPLSNPNALAGVGRAEIQLSLSLLTVRNF